MAVLEAINNDRDKPSAEAKEAAPVELPKTPVGEHRADEGKKVKVGLPKEEKTSGIPAWGWVGGIIVVLVIGWVIQDSSPSVLLTEKNNTVRIATVDTMISDADQMTLIRVPAGEFEMGSEEWNNDESPVHTVWLNEYWIDQTEVTNVMYQQCVEAGACDRPGGDNYWKDAYQDHPVVMVSWYQAKDYCEWAGRRLPTEAEWEKAAWGGMEGMKYPWGNEGPVCTKGAENGGQFNKCEGRTVPVGSFAPNGYGLYDMAGNVLEWVADWYEKDFYGRSPYENPSGPSDGNHRDLRGGSFINGGVNLRVVHRDDYAPDGWNIMIGFRCAASHSP